MLKSQENINTICIQNSTHTGIIGKLQKGAQTLMVDQVELIPEMSQVTLGQLHLAVNPLKLFIQTSSADDDVVVVVVEYDTGSSSASFQKLSEAEQQRILQEEEEERLQQHQEEQQAVSFPRAQ